MKVTLETIRNIIRESFGRNSVIASFVNRVEEDTVCLTASMSSEGVLRYNPAFTAQYVAGEEDLFCLVLHELMHPIFGHFIYQSGQLENLAADMVINASISLLFPKPSGGGSLFKKTYEPYGIEGLLRPQSRMQDSRYNQLYAVFYHFMCSDAFLSTGEVIQSLKVLTPIHEMRPILLLGSHDAQEHNKQKGDNGSSFAPETLCRLAEELKNAVSAVSANRAGVGENLVKLFLEALNTHLSIRRVLLQRFATRRKVDRFRQSVHRPAVTVSPIPHHPSKRDLVLLSAGIAPFHYHNCLQRLAVKEHGLAVYLDVSGSVNEYLPEIIGVLQRLKAEVTSIFLFSNKVVEVPFKSLLAGQVQTTYGTDFDCIAESIIERDFDKAVILTDGYAGLDEDKQAELKKRKLQTLTILFGGKTDCEEFAPFGDVMQLADIVN